MRLLTLALLLLSGCASTPPAAPRAPQGTTAPVPVEMSELRGREGAIFPDIAPGLAMERIAAHLRDCHGPPRRLPHGYAVGTPGDDLRIMVARVSESTAIALDGARLNAQTQEALADAISGRPRCAADS